MKPLSPDEIRNDLRSSVMTQEYTGRQMIDGVKVVDIKQFAAEDGTFSEILRLGEDGSLADFPGFVLRQVNRSKLLPGAIKAWHLHYNQEDIWYVAPEDHMMLGLWDVRESSPTSGVKMKLPLGAGTNRLIYIPRGVAHGVANLAQEPGVIFYYVNQQFNAQDPDERRLPWNAAGDDFWVPEKA